MTGNSIEECLSSVFSLTVLHSYDDLRRIANLYIYSEGSVPEPIAENITYLPFGPVSGYTLGNGIERNVSFDQDYRLTAINDAGEQSVLSLDYEYDDNGNIIDLNNVTNTGNAQAFDYDELDRLIQAEGGYGSINYDYDPVGNRLSKTQVTDTDTQDDIYNYFLDSNQLSSIDQSLNGEASLRSFELDENGNTIEDASTQTITYTYNAANRPITASGGATSGTYTYNALGQRVSKVISIEGTPTLLTTTYTYGEAGQLISEITRFTSGIIDVQSDQRDYVYLHNQLVAVIVTRVDPGAESGVAVNTYYVHNDHLNTPQILTDDTQQAIWQVESQTPFGELEINEDPDGDGRDIVFNVRFPGQYYDSESHTSYNYFQTYDQSLGRYIQSDPIGLLGGINTFGYVGGNPVKFVDPLGLVYGLGSPYSQANMIRRMSAENTFSPKSECMMACKLVTGPLCMAISVGGASMTFGIGIIGGGVCQIGTTLMCKNECEDKKEECPKK